MREIPSRFTQTVNLVTVVEDSRYGSVDVSLFRVEPELVTEGKFMNAVREAVEEWARTDDGFDYFKFDIGAYSSFCWGDVFEALPDDVCVRHGFVHDYRNECPCFIRDHDEAVSYIGLDDLISEREES